METERERFLAKFVGVIYRWKSYTPKVSHQMASMLFPSEISYFDMPGLNKGENLARKLLREHGLPPDGGRRYCGESTLVETGTILSPGTVLSFPKERDLDLKVSIADFDAPCLAGWIVLRAYAKDGMLLRELSIRSPNTSNFKVSAATRLEVHSAPEVEMIPGGYVLLEEL